MGSRGGSGSITLLCRGPLLGHSLLGYAAWVSPVCIGIMGPPPTPQPPASVPHRQTPTPCQAQASAGCQRGAQHPHPMNLLHTLKHPICTKGTDTLTWLLVTLGFSFPSHLEDHLVSSSLRVPSVGYPCFSPHCSQGHPPSLPQQLWSQTYPRAGCSWPGTEAGSGQGSSRHSLSICPQLYAVTLGAMAKGWACWSCSATHKHNRQPEPGIRENTLFTKAVASNTCCRHALHTEIACLAVARRCLLQSGGGPPAASQDGVKQQWGRCPQGCGGKQAHRDSGQLPRSATALCMCCRDLLLYSPLAGSPWRLVPP